MPSSEYDVLFKMIVIQTDSIKELGKVVDYLQKDNKDLQEQIKASNERMTDIVGQMHSKMIENSIDQLKIVARLSKDINVLRERLRNKD
jgi:transcriptional regulator with GAF, ATPase, and Fis domain